GGGGFGSGVPGGDPRELLLRAGIPPRFRQCLRAAPGGEKVAGRVPDIPHLRLCLPLGRPPADGDCRGGKVRRAMRAEWTMTPCNQCSVPSFPAKAGIRRRRVTADAPGPPLARGRRMTPDRALIRERQGASL